MTKLGPFKSGSAIICDENACFRTSAYENGIATSGIPSAGYKSPKGNSTG